MSNQGTLMEMQQLWWLLEECRLVWAGGLIHQLTSTFAFCGFPFTLGLPTYTFGFMGHNYLTYNDARRLSHLRENGEVSTQRMEESAVFLALVTCTNISVSHSSFLDILPPVREFCFKYKSTAVAEEVEIFWFSRWLLDDAANHRQSQN